MDEFDDNYLDDELYFSPFDLLSDAEQAEIEQQEVISDRYNAWRNEY